LCAGLTAAQTRNPALPKSDPAAASQAIRTQLRKSQIAPLTEQEAINPSSESLKEWTDQLQNLRLPQLQSLNTKPVPMASPNASVSPNPDTTPADNTSPTNVAQSTIPSKPRSAPDIGSKPAPVIADPVMATLAQNPRAVVDLFAAAEALFTKKDLSRAAHLFRQLMDEIGDNREIQNRSWVIFQYGNCIRRSKPVEVDKLFEKLIAEHPDSDWAAAAKSRKNWIQWSIQNKPEELIKKYGYDPNSL
jgi:TolA-binding protein